MSIGTVNQPSSTKQLNPSLMVRSGMRAASLLAACNVMLLSFANAACEQQVANAEQPPEVSSASVKSPASTEAGAKGKLVFDKPACQLPNRGGDVTGECSVIARINPERKGHLTYGPYVPLPAGDYAFEIEYRSSAEAASPAGRWDVAARLGAEEQVLAKGDIGGTGNNSQMLTGVFSVPEKPGGNPVLEVRMSPSNSAETEIKRLRIYEAAAH